MKKNETIWDQLERKLVLVTGDDWDAVYAEGLLIEQGHSIPTTRALEIGSAHGGLDVEQRDCNSAWLADKGEFPLVIRDVIWGDEAYVAEDIPEYAE